MEKEVEILSAASNTVTVKVLVSFFLSGSGGSVSSQAIHKEKFNVPINDSQDKTRQDKTFIIKISPVQFLGTQLAEKR